MAKDRTVKHMTDEQRERILQTPGVVVHRGDPEKEPARFKPAIWVECPISVRKLVGRDEDIWSDQDTTE